MSDNPVTAFKKSLVNMCITGHAVHFYGIIVQPSMLAELKNNRILSPETDTYQVMGTEGNRHVRYMFYIREDPSLPENVPFMLTHFTKERYEREIGGRIPEVLARTHQPRILYREGMTVTVLNEVTGVVELSYASGGSLFYNVHEQEIMDAVSEALAQDLPVRSYLEQKFGTQGPVRNPPETSWMGELYFDDEDLLIRSKVYATEPFRYQPDENGMPAQADLGRMLMDEGNGDPRIVGIVLDGYGKLRVVTMYEGYHDPMRFAAEAIQYFSPEEIFLALGLKRRDQLEAIRALPFSDMWGTWYDPQSIGRLSEWSLSSPVPGHSLEATVVDTKAKGHLARLLFEPEDPNEELWKKLRELYFPADWQGWPETDRDRAYNVFAATL